VALDGGWFQMGSDDAFAYEDDGEGPVRSVRVDPFRIAARSVSNRQFSQFVGATGYVTSAEHYGTSFVFAGLLPDDFPPTRGVVGALWWREVPGACWLRPEGGDSTLDGKADHPVVHVSWEDAVAYCRWSGLRLPTEAEWEYAARGGTEGTRYYWGNEFPNEGKGVCNTFTGEFPFKNTAADGFAGTSPVKAFPPNGYGLYDMAGNVWNWCSDFYADDVHVREKAQGVIANPAGPDKTFSAHNPSALERVTKGGSFLCSPQYCESYRPPARRGTPPDTGSGHVGFRCVRSAGAPADVPASKPPGE
jgi:formylglycine-generating enzyme required for sulfatase activity